MREENRLNSIEILKNSMYGSFGVSFVLFGLQGKVLADVRSMKIEKIINKI